MKQRALTYVLVLAAVACGEREPEVTIVPTTDPPTEVDSPAPDGVPELDRTAEPGDDEPRADGEDDATDDATPAPADAPQRVRHAVLELYDVLHPDATLRVPQLTRPLARRRVGALLLSLARRTYGDQFVDCAATLATDTVVSLRCTGSGYEDRGTAVPIQLAANLTVDGDTFAPFTLDDAFVSAARVTEALAERCRGRVNAAVRHAGVDAEQWEYTEVVCTIEPDQVGLTARGVTFRWTPSYGAAELGVRAESIDVPYRELEDGIVADGPVGRMLGVGVPRPAPPRGATRLVLGEPMPHDEAAFRWAELPADARADVELVVDGVVARLAARPSLDRAAADALAARAGLTLREAPARGHTVEPVVARTRDELVLRFVGDQHDVATARMLPRGALVVALLGEVEGRTSSMGAQRTWARVAVAPGYGGWVAGRYVERDTRCRPARASAALAGLDDDRAVLARVPLRRAGRSGDALLLVAQVAGRTRNAQAAVLPLSADCAVEAPHARARAAGDWVRAALATTRPSGGSSVLALVTDAGEHGGALTLIGPRSETWTRTIARLDDLELGVREGAEQLLARFPGGEVSYGEESFVVRERR